MALIATLCPGCIWCASPRDACPTGESADLASPAGPATVSYASDVVPILSRSGCLNASCHGGFFPSSLYDLRSYESGFLPGEQAVELGACGIVPGDPDNSFLIEKLVGEPRLGARMPLARAALPASDIELLRTWIREGARDN